MSLWRVPDIKMTPISQHFSAEEFACHCGTCEFSDVKKVLESVNPKLLLKLEEVREAYGRSMTVNSGLRCPSYNAKSGGVGNSPHLYGHAVDIGCSNGKDRFKIIMIAMTKGFTRIGVAETFIHLDVAPDPTFPQDVLWGYWK